MYLKTKTLVPSFSVIITVYNKADFIKNTLNSVINQTFQDFEIIVINDGSTDASEEIIKSFKDVRLSLYTIKNQGASIARNKGIGKAKHDYIALLDGDDIWHLDYLKYLNEAIQKFSNQYIFATSVSQKYEHKTVPVAYSFKQNGLYGVYNYFAASKKYSILTSSSTVFHKSVLDKTGLFDPNIISGQDVDMWIRFGIHYNIVYINKQLVIYNYSPSSLSNTTFNLDKKPKFNKYFDEEKDNSLLKAYLDRNRYSMAILSKLNGDKVSLEYYTSHLKLSNLSYRQNILLRSPIWVLRLLLKIKSMKGEKLYYRKN